MFYVYNIGGASSPYELGSLSKLRKTRKGLVQPVSSVDGVAANVTEGSEDSDTNIAEEEKDTAASTYSKVLQERREKALYVEDVMTSPVRTVSSQTPLKEIWQLFRQQRFRHVPVVNSDQLVGIISDRDVLPLVSDRDLLVNDAKELVVSDVMSSPVLTVRPQTKIRVAAKVLLDEHVGALPVVDNSDILTGMLTRTDILRAVVLHAPLEIWV